MGSATIPVTGVKAEFTADSAQGEKKLTGKTLHDLLLWKFFRDSKTVKVAWEQGLGILQVDKTAVRASQNFHSEL